VSINPALYIHRPLDIDPAMDVHRALDRMVMFDDHDPVRAALVAAFPIPMVCERRERCGEQRSDGYDADHRIQSHGNLLLRVPVGIKRSRKVARRSFK
jgi:hypothetical protein